MNRLSPNLVRSRMVRAATLVALGGIVTMLVGGCTLAESETLTDSSVAAPTTTIGSAVLNDAGMYCQTQLGVVKAGPGGDVCELANGETVGVQEFYDAGMKSPTLLTRVQAIDTTLRQLSKTSDEPFIAPTAWETVLRSGAITSAMVVKLEDGDSKQFTTVVQAGKKLALEGFAKRFIRGVNRMEISSEGETVCALFSGKDVLVRVAYGQCG
jgi:hypothetical protein